VRTLIIFFFSVLIELVFVFFLLLYALIDLPIRKYLVYFILTIFFLVDEPSITSRLPRYFKVGLDASELLLTFIVLLLF
jgi:hypothetical protein